MRKVLKLSTLFVLVLSVLFLVACAPKDPTDAKAKLEKADYAVVVDATITPGVLSLAGIKGVKSSVTASKSVDDKTISVTALYFESADDAKAAMKSLEDYCKNQAIDNEVKISGNWLYYGDDQACKDFA